jgi:hypothetical protein
MRQLECERGHHAERHRWRSPPQAEPRGRDSSVGLGGIELDHFPSHWRWKTPRSRRRRPSISREAHRRLAAALEPLGIAVSRSLTGHETVPRSRLDVAPLRDRSPTDYERSAMGHGPTKPRPSPEFRAIGRQIIRSQSQVIPSSMLRGGFRSSTPRRQLPGSPRDQTSFALKPTNVPIRFRRLPPPLFRHKSSDIRISPTA